jgi:acetylornithine deacetylase
MPIDVNRLTRELIDIPSVSDHEYEIALHLEALLTEAGFNVQRHEVGERRFNLLARTSAPPRVVLCTHIDTVPPFFLSDEDAEFIYGRGACDTKGILAAMLAAGERLLSQGIKEFAFLLVVAEETDSIGAKLANAHFKELGSEFVIVGEPTESQFVRASKGALTCRVSFHGVAAHSAYPERGDSAILKLTRCIEAIYAEDWGEDPLLGRSTVNVGVVRGGEKANIIPAHAELELIFRSVLPIAQVKERLVALISRFDGQLTYSAGNDAVHMYVPKDATWRVVGFNTDVPHLGNLGKPLLIGPGSILDAHTANERISKADLTAAIDTYVALVRRLLSGEIEFHG